MHATASTVLTALVTAAGLGAQNQPFTLPTQPVTAANNNIPFAAGIGRYQQWHAASELVGALAALAPPLSGPLRFLQVDFLAGTGQQTATTLDLQVAMAHAPPLGLGGIFDGNFMTPPVTVVPRRMVNLTTGGPGAQVVVLPFNNLFTWDGVNAVVVEVRVWGNGRANQPFPYDFLATSTALGKIDRAYALGSASAQFATAVQQGWGLSARFTVRPGAMLPFGAGCPGAGGFVPIGTVSPLASPGTLWTHQLNQAPAQRPAVLVIGDSNTMWGTTPLPMDMGLFANAPGCFLLTNPLFTIFLVTGGGGAGGGSATLPLQLPPITGYIGSSFYTQWLIGDPFAANGSLAATAGIWTIVAPVGG